MYLKNKFLIKIPVSKTTAGSTHTTENGLVLALLIQEFLQNCKVVSLLLQRNASRVTSEYKDEKLWLTTKLIPITLRKQLVNKLLRRVLAFVVSSGPGHEVGSVNSAYRLARLRRHQVLRGRRAERRDFSAKCYPCL